jgi:hypothetical protein
MLLPEKHILSKSTFMRGCQCSKALWLYKHKPELRGEISSSQQAIFDQGTNVGKLAEQLFPNGVDARPKDTFSYQQSLIDTQQYIADSHSVIYEAAFEHQQVLAALDILVRNNGKWHAYEVKSSTEVKETYLQDAALQYYIITQSGLPLANISIVYINNQYVKQGSLDIKKLFKVESILDQVQVRQPEIAQKVLDLKKVAKQTDMPVMDIGLHCSDPYECDFTTHCWQHIPEDSVFDLRGHSAARRSFDLYQQGILKMQDIPEGFKLNNGQQIQVSVHKTGEPVIDRARITAFLCQLEYPLYFMDFESYNTAIPELDGAKPYQQIPFQYSVYKQSKPEGQLEHFEFLAVPGQDPRKEFLERLLLAIENKGTVLAYNRGFENGRLNELKVQYPEKAEQVESLQNRIVDLMSPFQSKAYYLSAMKGSYSIKDVLPALVPDLNYTELEIGSGSDASSAYYQLQFEKDEQLVLKTRTALLKYCKMDTYAMVKLLDKLMNTK